MSANFCIVNLKKKIKQLEADKAALLAACKRLLGCPALNLDDLETEDREAIRQAQRAMEGES